MDFWVKESGINRTQIYNYPQIMAAPAHAPWWAKRFKEILMCNRAFSDQ
jgi:hypothetical protein